MKAHQATFPILRMCQVLGVSTSGYYAWRKRQPSKRQREDERILEKIRSIHSWSRGAYDAPRVHAELVERGVQTGENRVVRLMRQAGLQGVSRRRGSRTTTHSENGRIAEDLVEREFDAAAPDRL